MISLWVNVVQKKYCIIITVGLICTVMYPKAVLAYSTRTALPKMKDPDDHAFSQDDHDFGDGRPGDHHEILLKAT